MYVPREVEKKVLALARQYPVVTITGPRQSGKTTLCQKLFPDLEYFSLEKPDVRLKAQNDPNNFLKTAEKGMILDEIQRVPELPSYIQSIVDQTKRPGQFIITGSQQFELMSRISQSLAGRTAIIKLLPFSYEEIYGGQPHTFSLDQILYRGFYPRIFEEKLNPTEALSFYVNTYIERDLRDLINIKNLSKFELFLKLCAARIASVLNVASLANDCGINHNTAAHWLSLLEASYIIYLLKPHFKNFNKRLIKAPKLYFYDVGLAAYLLEITEERHLRNHPLKGHLFENFVVTELLKQRFNQVRPPNLYYFRDNVGREIDLLYDFSDIIFPVEIKSGTTITDDYFLNLNYYQKINPVCQESCLIYGGNDTFSYKGMQVISYQDIPLFKKLAYNNLRINKQ